MARTPPPFAPFEWMIAWRYLRARRAEGGVSVMTWQRRFVSAAGFITCWKRCSTRATSHQQSPPCVLPRVSSGSTGPSTRDTSWVDRRRLLRRQDDRHLQRAVA